MEKKNRLEVDPAHWVPQPLVVEVNVSARGLGHGMRRQRSHDYGGYQCGSPASPGLAPVTLEPREHP